MISIRLRAFLIGTACGLLLFLTGCTTLNTPLNIGGTFPGNYDTVAYRPKNPGAVRVKVSLQNRMVYVMENSRALLVTPVTIGIPNKPTPTGSYHVTGKIRNKRSQSYGFWVRGNSIVGGEATRSPGSGYHYVGYPMAYWVQFKPEYGFHAGPVWPVAHSHGCIRLHPNVAPKFFALVHEGTPVTISGSQPEDTTIGKDVKRPNDYTWKDPASSYMISAQVFSAESGGQLVSQ